MLRSCTVRWLQAMALFQQTGEIKKKQRGREEGRKDESGWKTRGMSENNKCKDKSDKKVVEVETAYSYRLICLV